MMRSYCIFKKDSKICQHKRSLPFSVDWLVEAQGLGRPFRVPDGPKRKRKDSVEGLLEGNASGYEQIYTGQKSDRDGLLYFLRGILRRNNEKSKHSSILTNSLNLQSLR